MTFIFAQVSDGVSPWVTAGGTVIAALVAAAVVWWVAIRDKPTNDTDVFVKAAVELVAPLRAELNLMHIVQDEQEKRIGLLESENRLLSLWARALTAQLQNAQIDPITLTEIRNLST